ncbi:MAG: AAA family ATPase, partial [Succinivibrio sp.]|nr:AAA family ATPase [Succinivibrio sp.]
MGTYNELTNSGLENFDELHEDGGIYIDKTLHLKGIYAQYIKPDGKPTIDKVLLFTRPRRFGKTLTLSMLKNFFELNYQNPSDRSRAEILFRGLAISEDKEFCEKYLGRYPVISLSLKNVDGDNFYVALGRLLNILNDLYTSFAFLSSRAELSAEQLSSYRFFLNFSNQNSFRHWSEPDYVVNAVDLISNSLTKLMSYLKTVFGQNVILLIDEYDVPLQKAKVHGYYEEMLDVIRGMFGSALKTNPNLEKGIVTGCLRITHESIFTGVNNFSVYGINDEPYRSFIGFTHQEVHELLESQELTAREGEVLHWYDGY